MGLPLDAVGDGSERVGGDGLVLVMTVIGLIGGIRLIGRMIGRIGLIGRMIGRIGLIRRIIGRIRRIPPISPITTIGAADQFFA